MNSGLDRQHQALLATAAGLAVVTLVLLATGLTLQHQGGTVALVGCDGGSLVAALLLAVAAWWH